MQILPNVPKELVARGYGVAGAVPVRCDCGVVFMWERRRAATCPTCKKTEVLQAGPGASLVPGKDGSGTMVAG